MFKRQKQFKPKKVILHHERMDDSFEGILIDVVDGHYILRAAKMVGKPERAPVTIQGDIMIPEAKVAFLQVLSEDGR